MPAEGDGSEAHPIFSAHTFKVEAFDSCRSCHSSPELFAAFAMAGTAFQIQELKGYLDFWAMTKAPAALQTKYGSKAWEYTAAGELSGGGAGPTSSEQSQIPDGIKKARFNLYLVNNDGSFGIHNGPLAVSLLEAGANWVAVELNK